MAKPKHNYRTCRDEDCPRMLCISYKDGYQDGVDDTMAALAAQDGE